MHRLVDGSPLSVRGNELVALPELDVEVLVDARGRDLRRTVLAEEVEEMAQRPLVLLDRLRCEPALSAVEPDRSEDLERRLGLGRSSGRLGGLPSPAVHLTHQHLHLRDGLLLGPPLPLAAKLDEVLLWPDLEADSERPAAAGLLDSEASGPRARHQLEPSRATRLGGPARESSPPQQPDTVRKDGG